MSFSIGYEPSSLVIYNWQLTKDKTSFLPKKDETRQDKFLTHENMRRTSYPQKDETSILHTKDKTSFSHTDNEHTVPAREG
jgi:hypothetical protein